MSRPHPGAGQNHRALGITNSLQNVASSRAEFGEIGGAPGFLSEVVFDRIVPAKAGRIDGCGLHVHRNVEPAWTWASILSQIPCALEVIPNRQRIVDQDRILSDVRDHADDVDFLVAKLAQAGDFLRAHTCLALNLARNNEHWNRVSPRPKHSVQRVDAPGPGGYVDHAGLAADAGISLPRHG